MPRNVYNPDHEAFRATARGVEVESVSHAREPTKRSLRTKVQPTVATITTV